MRDPNRIDRIIEKLRQLWHKYPHYRLGQLVSNLLGTGKQDVFFPEDDRWERVIDEELDRLKNKKTL